MFFVFTSAVQIQSSPSLIPSSTLLSVANIVAALNEESGGVEPFFSKHGSRFSSHLPLSDKTLKAAKGDLLRILNHAEKLTDIGSGNVSLARSHINSIFDDDSNLTSEVLRRWEATGHRTMWTDRIEYE